MCGQVNAEVHKAFRNLFKVLILPVRRSSILTAYHIILLCADCKCILCALGIFTSWVDSNWEQVEEREKGTMN